MGLNVQPKEIILDAQKAPIPIKKVAIPCLVSGVEPGFTCRMHYQRGDCVVSRL